MFQFCITALEHVNLGRILHIVCVIFLPQDGSINILNKLWKHVGTKGRQLSEKWTACQWSGNMLSYNIFHCMPTIELWIHSSPISQWGKSKLSVQRPEVGEKQHIPNAIVCLTLSVCILTFLRWAVRRRGRRWQLWGVVGHTVLCRFLVSLSWLLWKGQYLL